MTIAACFGTKMADLTIPKKRQIERLLQMDDGYVLNFSNREMQRGTSCGVRSQGYRSIGITRFSHPSTK